MKWCCYFFLYLEWRVQRAITLAQLKINTFVCVKSMSIKYFGVQMRIGSLTWERGDPVQTDDVMLVKNAVQPSVCHKTNSQVPIQTVRKLQYAKWLLESNGFTFVFFEWPLHVIVTWMQSCGCVSRFISIFCQYRALRSTHVCGASLNRLAPITLLGSCGRCWRVFFWRFCFATKRFLHSPAFHFCYFAIAIVYVNAWNQWAMNNNRRPQPWLWKRQKQQQQQPQKQLQQQRQSNNSMISITRTKM